MAKKISELPAATTPLAGTELVEIVQGGVSKKVATSALNGGGGSAGTQCIPVACSDETTALTAGTNKVTFRMPYAFTLSGIRGSLTTAQVSGAIFTVNVKINGTSILSTKLTLDNTEKSSFTAAIPAVISSASIPDDAEVTIDIDQIGDGTAKGLKVYLIGVMA